jgi:hypothetical protein
MGVSENGEKKTKKLTIHDKPLDFGVPYFATNPYLRVFNASWM